MLNVIDWVLRKCGWSLEKTTKSKRFTELVLKEASVNAIDPQSDEGVARDAGHLMMGKLLNTMPEKFAVMAAKKFDCKNFFSTEERALIRFCGEAIVEGAKECLPQEVIQMAERWKDVSTDEQLEMAGELYRLFRSDSQGAEGETLTRESVWQKILERPRKDQLHDQFGFLPGLYGQWNSESCWANCQGKAQMLVAFAKLAGTEARVFHPLVHARSLMTQAGTKARDLIVRDLVERGLEDADDEFAESMKASFFDDFTQRDSFHVGAMMRLRDDGWVLIDPHGLCWGKFSDSWNLGNSLSVLEKYPVALPGLTMMANDGGDGERLIAGKLETVRDLIKRSRRMEEIFRERVKTLSDLVDAISESDDLEMLVPDENKETKKAFKLFPSDMRRYFATAIIMGGEKEILNLEKVRDPGFLESRKKSWLSYYHCFASNLFLNRETDNGELIHPAGEISADAEWSIAVSAINSAAFRIGNRGIESELFFSRNSFDQTTLSNALQQWPEELGKAAGEALQALPYVHPLTLKIMMRKFSERR